MPGNRVLYGIDMCYSGGRFLRINRGNKRLRLPYCTSRVTRSTLAYWMMFLFCAFWGNTERV